MSKQKGQHDSTYRHAGRQKSMMVVVGRRARRQHSTTVCTVVLVVMERVGRAESTGRWDGTLGRRCHE
jgi:hypothetical protein